MRMFFFAFVSVLTGVAAAAQAQQPAAPPAAGGTPDAIPFDVPYGLAINIEQAKQAAAAVVTEARKGTRTWKLTIAVVDPAGDLVYLEKMDGAQTSGVDVSQGKARTSVRYRRESRAFYNAFETGHSYVGTLEPTLVAVPGGFPLISGGKIIGAIGCAGGTGDQDAAACKAGADTIK